jgi:iron complex outermembrane receptor protein
VRESVGNIIAITGNRDFRNEKLTALEIGIRAQPLSDVSFSVTGFYHRYDDLRTIELGTGPALLNFFWGNKLKGYTRGVEAWATVRPLSWWTLSAGATMLSEDFDFKPRATGQFATTGQNGTDPKHQFNLQSSMNLGRSVTLDMNFRAVGRLRGVTVPAYAELGGRLGWTVSDHLTLSLSGLNLLHAHHVEFAGGDAIPRKVLVGLEWRP